MKSRIGSPLAATALVALLAVPCLAPPARAQEAAPPVAEDQAPPPAEEVIAKAVAAGGGAEAAAKVSSRHVTGALRIPAMGLGAPLKIWQSRPGLMAREIASPEIGSMSSGTDGETCWENSSMQGPRILLGVERALALREADMDGLIAWQRWYEKAESAGADTVGGRSAWKILMTPREGNVETAWFDAESGHLVKQSMVLPTSMGEVPVTSWLEDYREVEGVTMPFRIRQSLMNGLQVMVIDVESVANNVEMPADRFALPAEIAALKAKAEAAAE